MESNYKNNNRKNPINRNNLFFSEEDFLFELNMGKDYLEEDINQTIVLYQIDYERTKVNAIYNESNNNEIVFKSPIELNVIFDIDDSELISYDKQHFKGMYLKTGRLHFSIYEKTLEENECDIKRGDYVGVQITPDHMEFFVVTNDGKKNYGNSQTMFGVKPYYRDIECSPVTDNNEVVNAQL